jgi:hypothetical protein
VVYIGISYSVDFIWDFPIAIGKPIHFGHSWLDPPVLLPSPYHNPSMDMFQICNALLTSLNVRIGCGLEQFHRVHLAKSALVTSAAKDDWSRAVERERDPTEGKTHHPRGTIAITLSIFLFTC